MGDYASKGVANAGLTTGIVGTTLAALPLLGGCGGLLGNVLGGNRCGCGALGLG